LNNSKQNFNIQKYIAILSLVLFFVKLFAWWLTQSVAILTDALESIVNVVASFVGLYSLHLAAKPKDADHPYGHGKVEFITAALEGSLIAIAGILVIGEAALNLYHPHQLKQLDYGIYLIAFAGLLNYVAGWICVSNGTNKRSLVLVSSGKHLISDTYTTLGIVIGLILLNVTGLQWIDSAVAIVFAVVIIITGISIVRKSIAGMMDEADDELLKNLIQKLNQNRHPNWIDLHNLRVIKYGSMIHIDCHLTVPWYLNVHEAHFEIDRLSGFARDHFGESVEMFVHTDGCLDFSCAICTVQECKHRKQSNIKRINWTMENVVSDKKHGSQI
jgi:cation diffusion facilitator family transporter